MKKLLILPIALLLASVAYGADTEATSAKEPKVKKEKAEDKPVEKKIKKGWTFGILPCLTYSSDMGLQYGAFGDVYYYGDGSTYPDPLHKISWEASHYTKGRTRAYLAYDSKYLIPKMRLTVSATYVNDPLYNFFGYNGSASPLYMDIYSKKGYYDEDGNAKVDPIQAQFYEKMGVPAHNTLDPHPGISYYQMRRDMVRILADFQGDITKNFKWAGGISYWWFNLGDFESKYGYDPAATMYRHYADYGLIGPTEVKGGHRLELKAGVVYDNRDIEAAPNKGIWSEVYLNGSPSVTGDGYNYLKLCAHWRHYVRIPVGFIPAGDPVFAYHLAYQGTIAGETPFYMQQNITALVLKQMISEGFGSYNTLRGTLTNRIIADGYAWGNFELRVKLVHFKLWRQFFYVAVNPFFDCGVVTQPYRLDLMAKLPEVVEAASQAGFSDPTSYLKNRTHTFLYSAGGGLKLAWNENFIISGEFGYSFNKGMNDAPLWMSIGVNYAF